MEGEAQNNGGGAPENQAPAFDPEAFKRDMMESSAAQIRSALEAAASQNKAMLEGILQANRSAGVSTPGSGSVLPADLQDFKDELEGLGLEEDQSKHLIKLMGKFMEKKAPAVEEKIKESVNKDITFTQKRNEYNARGVRQFPQAADRSSELFRAARVIYESEMTDSERDSPAGPYNAITRAAADLGIQPLSIAQIRAMEARSETGSGPGTGKTDQVDQKQVDFATSFGVNADAFKAKLKAINGKR